jgi:hypothetical protein
MLTVDFTLCTFHYDMTSRLGASAGHELIDDTDGVTRLDSCRF